MHIRVPAQRYILKGQADMSKTSGKPKAFGTGLVALDVVMNSDPQSPMRSWAGGTCGNVMSILAFLDWESFPIARMNGDPASQRVKADMKRWGVRLDFAGCGPTSHTPIIVQEIRKNRHGVPTHRFSWACPHCGEWLPGFKAVTMDAIEKVTPSLGGSDVFFFDRISRAALTMAETAAHEGAVVIFEPSGKSDPKLFAEALRVAHVVKYSDQRLADAGGAMQKHNAALLEVQTLGERGLRYRHRLSTKASDWKHLDSISAPRVLDTCGSGDWCTAGLITKLAVGGLKTFRAAGADKIRNALRYGQALAAWNCGFEGARGGMYVSSRTEFDAAIRSLLSGDTNTSLPAPKAAAKPSTLACPACPKILKTSGKAVVSRKRAA